MHDVTYDIKIIKHSEEIQRSKDFFSYNWSCQFKIDSTHTHTHTHTHTMEYYSATKKEQSFATYNNMNGPGGCCAKWNKSDRETQILVWYHLYVESK